MTIREYTEEDFYFSQRMTGTRGAYPIFRPCNNVIAASDAWQYVEPMRAVLARADGAGLAANQVDLDIPLFLFRFEGNIIPCYRPEMTPVSTKLTEKEEGCLSFPRTFVVVPRYSSIQVEFICQSNNKRRKLELYGRDARVFQHEFDHLLGRTILDYKLPASGV